MLAQSLYLTDHILVPPFTINNGPKEVEIRIMRTVTKTSIWFYSILLVLLLPLIGNAQYDFREGYIVTTSNDTIRGQINISNTKQSAKFCLFRSNSTATPVKYYPSDLISFKIDTLKLYISHDIILHGNQVQAFLEYMVDGIVDLYYYSDSYAEHYFIESDGILHELTNEVDIIPVDGKIMKVESNTYKSILKSIMRSTPQIYQEIDNSSFDPDDFIYLCRDFHAWTCPDEDCVVYQRRETKLNDSKIRIRFGLSAGPALTRSRLSASFNGKSYKPADRPYPWSSYPTVFLETSYYKQSRQITLSDLTIIPAFSLNISRGWTKSFQLDVTYQKNTFSVNNSSTIRESLSTAFIYRQELYFERKLRPFFNIGFTLNNPIKYQIENYNISYRVPDSSDGNGNVLYRNVNKELPEVQIVSNYPDAGFMLGVGFIYNTAKRFVLVSELRFDQTNHKMYSRYDTNLSSSLANRVTNLQLVVGAQF